MEIMIAERLGGVQFGKSTKVYKFEKIRQAKEAAIKNNPDIPLIDMGVGEPDSPADPGIVNTLANEAGKPENRWYADNGIPEFQEAAASYLEQVYSVRGLNPYEQILHGIGSKSIFGEPKTSAARSIEGQPVLNT